MTTGKFEETIGANSRQDEHCDSLGANIEDYFKAFEADTPDKQLQAIVKMNPTLLERDDGYIFASYAEMPFYFSSYEQWPEPERQIIAECGKQVLDIGCGPGRHALHLQSIGREVCAIDPSPGALRVAQARGVRNGRLMSLASLEKLTPHSFDTALLLGHNLGLLSCGGSISTALSSISKCVRADGNILASTRDPGTARLPEHETYRARNLKAGRIQGHMSIRVRYRNLIGPWFDFFYATLQDVERMVSGTGWKVDTVVRRPFTESYAISMKRV